ncbi:MAG: DMT family transporter [Rhodobiaceae bacterium]|nr:DMT family transporter [Rhodobiaceae bacterium]
MPEPIRKATPVDLALIVILALIWATAFQAIKVAGHEVPPFWLAVARVGTALTALLPWALFRGLVLPQSAREWRMVLALVVLNIVIPFSLINAAERTISSGETALLLGIGPLAGLILSHFLTEDDRLNLRKLIAVGLGFAGISMVIGVQAFQQLGTHIVAQASVLLASICYVSSGIIVRHVHTIPPVRLSALTFSIAAVLLLPLAWLFEGPPPAISASTFWPILYLGLFPSGVATILRFHLLRQVGVSMFAHVGNLIPVFGVMLGAVLLGETITGVVIAALVLILGGVALARTGAQRQP